MREREGGREGERERDGMWYGVCEMERGRKTRDSKKKKDFKHTHTAKRQNPTEDRDKHTLHTHAKTHRKSRKKKEEERKTQ
jgi:hypothetical protein